MIPETQYTRLGDRHIAWQVLGDGATDFVWNVGRIGSMEGEWADPEATSMLLRIASFCRMIRYDALGTGSSDPVTLESLPPLEASVEEMMAVMDAAQSERAVLFGGADSGPAVMLAAASRPERVIGLILFTAAARVLASHDYPAGISPDEAQEIVKLFETDIDQALDLGNPSRANNAAYARQRQAFVRLVAGPGAFRAYVERAFRTDVRSLLPSIRVPTLIIHKQDNRMFPVALSHYLADHIEHARLVVMPGADTAPFWEDSERVVELFREFLQEVGPKSPPRPRVDRVMATLLFTDVVASTQTAQAVGDGLWRQLLEMHDNISRRLVAEYGGRIVKHTGDGILARFETPGRAILSAAALRNELDQAGLPIRAGIHTGEVELRDGDLGGVGVHIAARVLAAAAPGEIFVSRTVKDLVVGSQIHFEDRGTHLLRGVEGEWQLFSVATT